MKMHSPLRTIVFASALIGFAGAAQAAEEYVLDKAHTNFLFFVDHMGFSKMLGRFGEFDGKFSYDKANLANSTVSLTVKTASVDTFHEKRDAHLRSPDFLNSGEFPEMRFVSTKIEPTGPKSAKLTGNLTLMGVTKPVTFDMTVNRDGLHNFNKRDYVAGFSARGVIKRSEFGIRYGVPLLGDEMELMIEAEGIRQ